MRIELEIYNVVTVKGSFLCSISLTWLERERVALLELLVNEKHIDMRQGLEFLVNSTRKNS